jgi:hypothetical protein
MPRVRGYGGGYSRSVARLEMAYGGPAGQGEGLEYEYSSRISQITRLKHAFFELCVCVYIYRVDRLSPQYLTLSSEIT